MFERLEGKLDKVTGPTTLATFINDYWFKEVENSSAYMRIYTSLNIPHDNFIPLLKGALKEIEFQSPVRISYSKIDDVSFSTLKQLIYAGEDGTTILETQPEERQLKKSNYIILTTPCKIDGTYTD